MKRNRAKAELEQLKAEDPLPLRRAKITQEAARRKVEKVQKKLEVDLQAASMELEELKTKGNYLLSKLLTK